jgi:hypothetical protein
VPLDENVLQALAGASKFSTAQLDRIANGVLGASLANISNASIPERQAQDMIGYAKQYDLLRELAAAFLYTGADKPGLQNLLLGENMTISSSGDRGNSENYIMLRIESKVDNISLRLDNFEQRVRTIEAVQATQTTQRPMTTMDRLFMLSLAILVVGMFAYNILGMGAK